MLLSVHLRWSHTLRMSQEYKNYIFVGHILHRATPVVTRRKEYDQTTCGDNQEFSL